LCLYHLARRCLLLQRQQGARFCLGTHQTDAVEECRSADVAVRDARAALHAHHPPRNMTFNQELELVQAAIFVDLLKDYDQVLAHFRQAEVRWDTLHLTIVSLLFHMVTITCIYSSHVRDHAGHL